MKINLKVLLVLFIMFTIFGTQSVLCSEKSKNKTTSKTYTTRNSQGVSSNRTRVYSNSSGQVTRIDYYNSQGVRKGYTKVGR